MTPQTKHMDDYASQYDAILKTMDSYVEGVKQGKSQLMRPVFHPSATFFGHYPGGVMEGPIQQLFDWVDNNGPAPQTRSRCASIEIVGAIASVRVEVESLSGTLAGADVSMSDLFTLMKTENGWTIVQKAFHWHT